MKAYIYFWTGIWGGGVRPSSGPFLYILEDLEREGKPHYYLESRLSKCKTRDTDDQFLEACLTWERIISKMAALQDLALVWKCMSLKIVSWVSLPFGHQHTIGLLFFILQHHYNPHLIPHTQWHICVQNNQVFVFSKVSIEPGLSHCHHPVVILFKQPVGLDSSLFVFQSILCNRAWFIFSKYCYHDISLLKNLQGCLNLYNAANLLYFYLLLLLLLPSCYSYFSIFI